MEQQFLNIAKTADKKARIEIDGTIGGWDWVNWKPENTGRDIRKQLDDISALDVDEIEVLITSLGGVVNDAIQIYDALKSHPAKITTIVQGFCASAATVIACAGDTRLISPNALYLIHKCRSSYYDANENRLKQAIEDQRAVDEIMLNVYRGVLKKDEAELTALFDANNGEGKWITADEALDFGFATGIQEFEENKAPATAMARFLNHARAVFPDMNSNPLKTTSEMKKIQATFAMLASVLALGADAEYDDKTGMQLTPEQMQSIEDTLKAFEDLKAKCTQNESDLQKAQEKLAAATASVEEKDALIASLTAERDEFKAKYENAPAPVQTVDGPDSKPKVVDVTDNPVYDQLEQYL